MNEKDFRICLDVTTIDTIPFNFVWYNVKPCLLKTVADLKLSILQKFDLTDVNINLFLNGGVVLNDEDVTIFRENDTVKLLHKAGQFLSISNTSLNLKWNKKEKCESALVDGFVSTPKKEKDRSRRSSHKDEQHLPISGPSLNLESDKKDKYPEHVQNDTEAFQIPKMPKHMKPFIELIKIQEAKIKNSDFENINLQVETKNVSEQNLKTDYGISDLALPKINAPGSTFTNSFASNCSDEVSMQDILDCTDTKQETRSKKRKRKRHRKHKSDTMNDSCLWSSMNDSHSTPEAKAIEIPVNDGYASFRKHIKYESSLENPLTVLNQDSPIVGSDSDDPSSSDEKIKNICSKITFFKPPQPYLMQKNNENKTNAQSMSQKKVHSKEAAAIIEMCEDVPKALNKVYENCPIIKSVPEIGTKIAFKVLELNEHYCPELTDYKEGTVVNVNRDTENVVVKLQTAEVKEGRIGKFENLYEDDEIPSAEVVSEIVRRWCEFIEPRRL